MKFKVGDKVRIVKNVWNTPVHRSDVGIGEIHTIKRIEEWMGRYPYVLDAHLGFNWCEDELELVEDKKVFTKSDLKNGDIIVRRNGWVEVVIVDLNVLLCRDGGWNTLSDVKADLTDVDSEYDDKYDIVKVYRPTEEHHCCFSISGYTQGELVYDRERDTEKPLYNGKVVCINNTSADRYTVGKIYEFKNGELFDNGVKLFNARAVHSFEEWENLTYGKFIEIKE